MNKRRMTVFTKGEVTIRPHRIPNFIDLTFRLTYYKLPKPLREIQLGISPFTCGLRMQQFDLHCKLTNYFFFMAGMAFAVTNRGTGKFAF